MQKRASTHRVLLPPVVGTVQGTRTHVPCNLAATRRTDGSSKLDEVNDQPKPLPCPLEIALRQYLRNT